MRLCYSSVWKVVVKRKMVGARKWYGGWLKSEEMWDGVCNMFRFVGMVSESLTLKVGREEGMEKKDKQSFLAKLINPVFFFRKVPLLLFFLNQNPLLIIWSLSGCKNGVFPLSLQHHISLYKDQLELVVLKNSTKKTCLLF